MIGIGNLLLRWASELGGGKVAELRSGVLRTARSRGLAMRDGAEARWISHVSALAHLDVDWRRGVWSAAPPVLTRLPFSDGLALITGRRTASGERTVDAAVEEWAVILRAENEVADGDIPLPDSLLVQYDDPEDLPKLASSLGFTFTPCAAQQTFALLPDIKPGSAAARPAPGNTHTIQRFDLATRYYQPADSYNEDGLYRWRGADWSRLIQVRRGTQWLSTEHEYGVYLELARHGQHVLQWRQEAKTGRERVGTLYVERGAPLPPLHARAAVLCTGLHTHFDHVAEITGYDNVSRTAAERLAQSLQQDLKILPPGAAAGKVK